MPKTRNAFAFKDFDSARILQRPFFKEFRFDADKTDKEILQSLMNVDKDSALAIEIKQQTLKEIAVALTDFLSMMDRHCKRLGKYLVRIKENFNPENTDVKFIQNRMTRGNTLFFNYTFNLPENYINLEILASKCYEKIGSSLQGVYRREFGERLRQARKKAGLSREVIGDFVGLSPNSYGQYETGRHEPSVVSLIKLSRILNVSLDWLIRGLTP